jgi:hypothetical protein
LAAEHRPHLLGGLTVITGKAQRLRDGGVTESVSRSARVSDPACLPTGRPKPPTESLSRFGRPPVNPGARSGDRATAPVALTAIPYYAWDHREPGEMAVWLIEQPAACGPTQTAAWVGSNYTPAYCVNQVQMWHDFRPEVVDRELAAARKCFGIHTLRVYLHNINHEAEKDRFLANLDKFLERTGSPAGTPGGRDVEIVLPVSLSPVAELVGILSSLCHWEGSSATGNPSRT